MGICARPSENRAVVSAAEAPLESDVFSANWLSVTTGLTHCLLRWNQGKCLPVLPPLSTIPVWPVPDRSHANSSVAEDEVLWCNVSDAENRSICDGKSCWW